MFVRKSFILGWLWLLIAGAVIVLYRALTQSLTIDESYAYHLYLNHEAAALFSGYNSAYHVLHTWACWIATHCLGKGEAIIRLPSMVAGLFYLAGTGVLCRRLLGDGWRFPVGVVLLSTHPLVADHLSAARGYGAALAFFVWAFDALLSHRPARSSALMALSVACNLTFAVPAVGACAVYLTWQARLVDLRLPLLKRLGLPFLAIALPVLAIPLSHARGSDFYFGTSDLTDSLNSLVASSLAHGDPVAPSWARTATRTGLPLFGAAILLAGILATKQRGFPAAMAAGTLALTLLILAAAHELLGVLYPWTRTGLYLIWLFLVSCLALWGWAGQQRSRWHRPVSLFFGGTSVLLAALFVAQFETRYYYEYRDDAQMSALMQRLGKIDPGQPACIGGSWRFETTANYYRHRYRLTWVDEMKRTAEPQLGCRFFLLSRGDRDFVDRLGLRQLWSDPVSGAILAEAVR